MSEWSVADQLAIRNLYAGYTFAVDDHDAEAYVDCFTPDAEIEVMSFEIMRDLVASGKVPFVNASGRVVGAGNIRKLSEIMTALTQHLSCNLHIKHLAGDYCEAQAAFVVIAEDGQIEHYGRYLDKLVRGPDQRWRFKERCDICRYERKPKFL